MIDYRILSDSSATRDVIPVQGAYATLHKGNVSFVVAVCGNYHSSEIALLRLIRIMRRYGNIRMLQVTGDFLHAKTILDRQRRSHLVNVTIHSRIPKHLRFNREDD